MNTGKSRLAATVVVAAVLWIGATLQAIAGAAPLKGDETRAAAVWATFDKWLKAYSDGDLAGTMAIFDRQLDFAFQGSRDLTYADMEASYVADFKTRTPGTVWVPDIAEIYADDHLAFVRSVWELHVAQPDGSMKTTARNRSIDIFHQAEDGSWRIFRSLNYPEKG